MLHLQSEMPSLDGATAWLNSEPLTPGALRGRPVLVEFWALSCPICRETMPKVRAWRERFEPRGLQFVGVHTPLVQEDTDLESVKNAVREHGLDFPQAVDSEGRMAAAFETRYTPAFYLFGGEGRLRHYRAGAQVEPYVPDAIERLLEEEGGH